ITEKRLAHIFTEFSESGSDYEHQGTGLGLPIVKQLLDQMDSEIILNSTRGKGTEASFLLWFDLPQGINGQVEEKTVSKFSFQHKNILVVDDNKINLLVTKKTLEKHGAHVTVANSGMEGIELAQKRRPDLILMDINMPGMNGYETTEKIRSNGITIPILALTAVEREKIMIKNTNNLFNDFIIKPYKNEEFLQLISNHLQRSRIRSTV
ncbi:MAG: response regulator, partial [Bacteroidota bacterium]